MNPTTLRSLLTFGAVAAGSAAQMPGVNPILAQALVAVAGFLAGWAHMQKPGADVPPAPPTA